MSATWTQRRSGKEVVGVVWASEVEVSSVGLRIKESRMAGVVYAK